MQCDETLKAEGLMKVSSCIEVYRLSRCVARLCGIQIASKNESLRRPRWRYLGVQ